MSVNESHHSQQKIKLCQQIVKDHFGPIAASITGVLLARGRLSLQQIVKFLNTSTGAGSAAASSAAGNGVGVPRGGPLGIGSSTSSYGSSSSANSIGTTRIHPSTVEHHLLSLVQNNCAWHVLVSLESGHAIFGPALVRLKEEFKEVKQKEGAAAAAARRAAYQEFFEVNPDEIIPRMRFGAYIGVAEQRFGQDAGEIIRLLLKHGQLAANDIIHRLAGDDPMKSTKISRLLLLLLHRTYIRPSLVSSHISPRDKFIAYETDGKLVKRGSVFTPKELRQLKDNVAERIEAEDRLEWEGGAGLIMSGSVAEGAGLKGKASGNHMATGRLGIIRTGHANGAHKSGALSLSSSRSSKKRKHDATRLAASTGGDENGERPPYEPSWDDGMDEDALLAKLGQLDVMHLTHPALAGCEVDKEIYLRVHYDRFDVHVRDDVIYQAVRSQHNVVVADVFRLFARAGEFGDATKGGSTGAPEGELSTMRMSVRDERSGPISLNGLSINFPESINLPQAFPKKSFSSSSSSSSSRKNGSSGPSRAELIAEYAAVLSCAEDIAGAGRKRRFLAPAYQATSSAAATAGDANGSGKGKSKLANGNADGSAGGASSRASRTGGSGTTVSAGGTRVSNVFVVEYAEICGRLKRAILKDVVAEKFGSAAVRVIGVLLEKGKLEEKYISKLGLLSLSHTRHICARLFESSLLGLQEVPKSNDRQPARTFFLWYVDLPAAYAWLLEGMYQTLARIGQRRGEELRRERALVNKVERTDVAASMTALLSEGERAAWQSLQAALVRLAVAEQRVASEAFVIASLPGE
ncbi:RNA polymerase III subunit C82 [Tilletia horrida]|nr:RNA polymerase III subunit C82 [Tilletia horrida]